MLQKKIEAEANKFTFSKFIKYVKSIRISTIVMLFSTILYLWCERSIYKNMYTDLCIYVNDLKVVNYNITTELIGTNNDLFDSLYLYKMYAVCEYTCESKKHILQIDIASTTEPQEKKQNVIKNELIRKTIRGSEKKYLIGSNPRKKYKVSRSDCVTESCTYFCDFVALNVICGGIYFLTIFLTCLIRYETNERMEQEKKEQIKKEKEYEKLMKSV